MFSTRNKMEQLGILLAKDGHHFLSNSFEDNLNYVNNHSIFQDLLRKMLLESEDAAASSANPSSSKKCSVGEKKPPVAKETETEGASKESSHLDSKMETTSQKVAGPVSKVLKVTSTAVTIKENDIMGRYAVAAEKIDVASCVLYEKPIVSVLLPSFWKSYCNHCMKRFKNSFPCPKCNIKFCSRKCRLTSAKTHHFECNILNSLKESSASDNLMVLRLISSRDLDYFLSIKSCLQDKPSFDEKLDTDDYRFVYNLHAQPRRQMDVRVAHDLLLTCYFLAVLKRFNFFKETDVDFKTISKLEFFIAELLYHNVLVFATNSHSVYVFKYPGPNDIMDGDHEKIGLALYPVLSLFNHSCDANVCRINIGHASVLYTNRNVRKGEMLGDSYGCSYQRRNKVDRQMYLMTRLQFSCTCVACVEDWPLPTHWPPKHTLDHEIRKLRCPNKECDNIIPVESMHLEKCPVCQKSLNFKERSKEVSQIFERQIVPQVIKAAMILKMGKYEESLELAKQVMTKIQNLAGPPLKEMNLVIEVITDCLSMKGSRIIEDIYPDSLELMFSKLFFN